MCAQSITMAPGPCQAGRGFCHLIDHIAQLKPDPKNARRHTPRNVGMIADALHEVGAARSIVIDEDDVILAGNATIEAAAQAGIERVRVIEADGNEIIAVRRSGMTKRQKKRLAYYDNRAAELAEWEPDVLSEDKDFLEGLFSDNELSYLLGDVVIPDDPREHWDGMPEYEQDDLGAYKTIKVHFVSQADYEAFGKLVDHPLTDKTKFIWYPRLEKLNLKEYRTE